MVETIAPCYHGALPWCYMGLERTLPHILCACIDLSLWVDNGTVNVVNKKASFICTLYIYIYLYIVTV